MISLIDLQKFYENREDFRHMVDQEAKRHRTTLENALRLMIVQEYYKELIKEGK